MTATPQPAPYVPEETEQVLANQASIDRVMSAMDPDHQPSQLAAQLASCERERRRLELRTNWLLENVPVPELARILPLNGKTFSEQIDEQLGRHAAARSKT